MNHTRVTSVIAVCLVVVIGPGCHRREAKPSAAPPTTEVWLAPEQATAAKLVVEPLEPQPVGGVVVASGRVTFDDLHVAHVLSPVTGRVVKIEAQPGQRVKKGDALAVIESPDVATAFSDLAKAQADFGAAEKEANRQKELFDLHAGSQRDFEGAQSNFSKARAELDRARKKTRILRGSSSDRSNQMYTLHTPIDGEVIARNVNPGAEVQGQYTGGTVLELFTVGELDSVWVLGDIFEMDLGRVKAGTACLATVVSYPGRVFRGLADWVSDTLDPATHTSKVRCKIVNSDRALKPEMYATVTLPVDRQVALAIPRGALLRLGDQTVVFVEVGKTPDGRLRFERRPVVVNEEMGNEFLPVLRNLAKGERIVVSGAILLSGML
ncbi:MAG: efflux RND transporter periplasmic adaptor subunit [Polyangia bacterium]|jgi:cobalt-zinc-cadmium efflux system membrane fusion protein